MVLVQNKKFFQILFLGNIAEEKVFYEILERKKAFLGYKNKKFKKSKNGNFCKGVNPWFWSSFGPKMAMFPTFFLGNIGQENVFSEILERENDFPDCKKKKFKKSKN